MPERLPAILPPALPATLLICAALALPANAQTTAQTPTQTQSADYRLHAQDRLRLRVLVWDFTRGELSGLSALSGEYSIGPDGMLQIPLAGMVQARGRSLNELRGALADLIRRSAGLDQTPALSVELIGSLPVYVTGAVATPGAVDFRPGLSVRQALALAGGPWRPMAGADAIRLGQLQGDLGQWDSTAARLRDEATRLTAELAEIAGQPAPPPAPDRRGDLRRAETDARAAQSASLSALRDLLAAKAGNLRARLALRDRQLTQARADLAAVEQLHDKGLANNARRGALSAALSDLEANRLELETALLLTEQEQNQTARAHAALTEEARSARLRRLVALEAELEIAEIRQRASRAMLGAALGAPDEPPATLWLTRNGPDGPRTAPARPDDALRPGDVLELRAPSPLSPAKEAP